MMSASTRDVATCSWLTAELFFFASFLISLYSSVLISKYLGVDIKVPGDDGRNRNRCDGVKRSEKRMAVVQELGDKIGYAEAQPADPIGGKGQVRNVFVKELLPHMLKSDLQPIGIIKSRHFRRSFLQFELVDLNRMSPMSLSGISVKAPVTFSKYDCRRALSAVVKYKFTGTPPASAPFNAALATATPC